MFETAGNSISKVKGVGNRQRVVGGALFKAAVIIVICYAAETGIMHLLARFNLESSAIAPVLDSLALILVMTPFVYLLFIRPMKREMEEKKALSASLEKLSRTLLTVSNCNQALVRATDGQQLMEDVCRVLTETGGYRMAWIGLAEHDAEKTVRLAAYSGHNEGYVETLNMTWADTERGQSPIGSAIRTGEPVVVRNIAADPHFTSGGGGAMEALKRGYASMAALPLTDGETVIGSLNIYSDKADAFDADEMRLLMELAADLSFGIRHQRLKDEHERARRELDLRYRITKIFLTVPDDGMYADVLTVVLDAMKSRYGSFGYINEAGDLICPSMTRDVYERCNVPEKTIVFPRDKWGGLWGRSLLERKTLYSNSPYRVPEGHIPITRSISTPIIYQDKLVGHLHVANKESDYDERDVGLLENLAETIAPVLAARLEKQAHEAARQKMQGELEASEKKFKGLADNALVGVVQSTTGGKMLYANNALLEMFEFDSLEEIISTAAPKMWKNPEDRKKMVEQLKSSGRASFEAEMLTKTGKTIAALYSAVVSDDTISATVLDITERKIEEEALRVSEERLNEAQRIGRLGFLDWDLITNEIECSDETLRIYGLDTGKKKLKFEEIAKLVHPDDVDIAVKSMNNAIEKGVEHHIEHRIVRPDGNVVYVDTRAEIIRDANGKPIRMLGTNLDITERKRAEVALRSANEELKTAAANMEKTNAILLRQEKLASIGTLSAGVAHEILNPLNIIGTIVQLMQMDEWPEKTKENLNEIMAQIRRATKITNNLRMFAHVHKREITAVDVHALFDKTATLIEYDLNLDNIMIERDYDQNLPLIFVDQDLFAQVFLNLLTNARHALQEVKDRKKSISIKTRAVDGKVEIRLSNNGPRIPEDIIGHIFDPFFTTKDPNKGTGLGLSMAHTFIQDFGGTITVQNEAPEGVTFIITLPAKGE